MVRCKPLLELGEGLEPEEFTIGHAEILAHCTVMDMKQIRTRIRARDIAEEHRVSSPLELLFDLTFVVAVGALVAQLAAAVEHGRAGDVIVPFLMVFFAIWWAWNQFTWLASAYDNDDVLYRVFTMVQM